MNMLKKNFEYISSKQKLVIFFSVFLIVSFIVYLITTQIPKWEQKQLEKQANEIVENLTKEKIIFEYGEKININLGDYKNVKEEYEEDIKFLIDIENEEGKEYPSVGKYQVKMYYKEIERTLEIEVTDETAPNFVDLKESINIEVNAENVDFKKYFDIEDLSDYSMEVDSSEVDLSTVGQYKLLVSAMDIHENKTEKEIIINVISKEKADNGECTSYADGSGTPRAKETVVDVTLQNNQTQSIQSSTNTNPSSNNSSSNNSSTIGWRDPKTLRHGYGWLEDENGNKIEGSETESWYDENGNLYDEYGYPLGKNIWDW